MSLMKGGIPNRLLFINKGKICIEYDGEQHYKKTRWSHDDFEERKYRDSIKNQYCLNNDILLIRIPYWDYDKLDKNHLLQLIES